MKLAVRLLAAVTLTAGLAAGAFAQTYPAKPVQRVVPFTAGGPTDTVARSLAQAMSKHLGQSIVVESIWPTPASAPRPTCAGYSS